MRPLRIPCHYSLSNLPFDQAHYGLSSGVLVLHDVLGDLDRGICAWVRAFHSDGRVPLHLEARDADDSYSFDTVPLPGERIMGALLRDNVQFPRCQRRREGWCPESCNTLSNKSRSEIFTCSLRRISGVLAGRQWVFDGIAFDISLLRGHRFLHWYCIGYQDLQGRFG